MKQRMIAIGVGVSLVALAAVGTFASQDFTAQEETPTPEATETLEPTATPELEATATEEPTSTPEPDATATPVAGDENADGGEGDEEDGAHHGIPDSNPVFEPDDDGNCEKHETAIKTTPSGNEVTVPCHAAEKKGDDGERNGNKPKDDEGDQSGDSNDQDEVDDHESDSEHEDDGGDDADDGGDQEPQAPLGADTPAE